MYIYTMHRGKYENELKQVLGDIYMADDIGPDDVIIIGKAST